MDIRRLVPLPKFTFQAFEDTHVDGEGARRMSDDFEEGYRLDKEVFQRLLVNEPVESRVFVCRSQG